MKKFSRCACRKKRKKRKKNKTIKITVEKGMVTKVWGVPKGYKYEIKDLDTNA